MMGDKKKLEGTWVTSDSSDDYNIEYTIKSSGDSLLVSARDYEVDEELEISDVRLKGNLLSFNSLIPAIQRKGFNQFRIKENGNIEAKFTFTVTEELKKIPPQKDAKEDIFCGRWVAVAAYDENEHLREYLIKKNTNGFSVKGKFLLDGEEMDISDVKWYEDALSFMSFMPSTRRSGFNHFKLNPLGNIDSTFTFTVVEELKKAA